jgi:hypothetical protein
MTFYDDIIDFFEENNNFLSIINEQNINIFQSKIIQGYEEVSNGSDEYFEDKVMNIFDEIYNRYENEDAYDDICNNIIIIYYRSIIKVNNYYCNIYKKKKFYL